MKKANDDYELRDDYDLLKMQVMPKGRYAPERRAGRNIVVLEPDVAQAFPTDEAVNKVLHLLLEASRIPTKAVR